MTTTSRKLTVIQMRDARSLVREYGYPETLIRLRTWAQEPDKAAYWKAVEQYLIERHKKQAPKSRYRSTS